MLFNALPTVRVVHRLDALPIAARAYTLDTMTLGWEERLRSRGRRRTDHDVQFGTALPRGTLLREDDSLIVDELQLVAVIREMAEPVFVIEPRTSSDWAIFAYAIGNSHQPLMVTAAAIICPDILGMRQVLEYHGIPFRPDSQAFTPIGPGGEPYAPAHRHEPQG